MTKTAIAILLAALIATLATDRAAFAQQSVPDVPSVADDDGADGDGAGDLLGQCRDSLLLEPFPILRALIDLLSQLLELLNQADGLLNGGSEGDVSEIPDDLSDLLGFDGTQTDGTGGLTTDGLAADPNGLDIDGLATDADLPTIPTGVTNSDALPGGWGVGPILSVP